MQITNNYAHGDSDNLYAHMNDDEERGGRQWACDDCFCETTIAYDHVPTEALRRTKRPRVHGEMRFYIIDKDTPANCIKKWRELCAVCRGGFTHRFAKKDIAEQIPLHCQLETNRQLPYLDRMEGGLGHADKKQIRFLPIHECEIGIGLRAPIYNSNGNNSNWTVQEVEDLTAAFKKVADEYVGGQYVHSQYGMSCGNEEI